VEALFLPPIPLERPKDPGTANARLSVRNWAYRGLEDGRRCGAFAERSEAEAEYSLSPPLSWNWPYPAGRAWAPLVLPTVGKEIVRECRCGTSGLIAIAVLPTSNPSPRPEAAPPEAAAESRARCARTVGVKATILSSTPAS
jgi:hypothetical protein